MVGKKLAMVGIVLLDLVDFRYKLWRGSGGNSI